MLCRKCIRCDKVLGNGRGKPNKSGFCSSCSRLLYNRKDGFKVFLTMRKIKYVEG